MRLLDLDQVKSAITTGDMKVRALPQSNGETLSDMVKRAASETGVSAGIIGTIILIESTWSLGLGANWRSSNGMLSVTQIRPGSHPQHVAAHPDPRDVYPYVRYGATYFNEILRRYGGNMPQALAGYNAGPNHRTVNVNPFVLANTPAESRNYVTKFNHYLPLVSQILGVSSGVSSNGLALSEADILRRIRAAQVRFNGYRYVWGATTGRRRDCSSYVRDLMFAAFPGPEGSAMHDGTPTNNSTRSAFRVTAQQVTKGVEVAKQDLKVGDLVFFKTASRAPSHVGIWLGNGKFLHCSTSRGANSENDLATYSETYMTARRVLASGVAGTASNAAGRWNELRGSGYQFSAWGSVESESGFNERNNEDSANSMSLAEQMAALNVLPSTGDPGDARTPNGGKEDLRLIDLPAPVEGELDIGDLRFGSQIQNAIDESHLNQPSSVSQQNAATVGVIELLRTEQCHRRAEQCTSGSTRAYFT